MAIRGHTSKDMMYRTGQKNTALNGDPTSHITCRHGRTEKQCPRKAMLVRQTKLLSQGLIYLNDQLGWSFKYITLLPHIPDWELMLRHPIL